MKKCEKVPKSVKYYETILPFSCCPSVFPRNFGGNFAASFQTPHQIKAQKLFGENFGAFFVRNSCLKQRTEKRTRPPPKENLLGNFSGQKEKLSGPVVDTKTL